MSKKSLQDEPNAAIIGQMFVTSISFQYHSATRSWNGKDYDNLPGHWEISATLRSSPERYGDADQTFSLQVEQGIGQKLAEIIMPVVVADASRKAQQLADDSKAMLEKLGEHTIKCIVDMPPAPVEK